MQRSRSSVSSSRFGCRRRRAPAHGLLLVLIILMPFGAWIYFFAVKIHEYDLRALKRLLLLERPPTVDELRYLVEQTPSIENRVKLADALRAPGNSPSRDIYRIALDHDAKDCDSLYGIGVCRLGNHDPEGAIEHLAQVLELTPRFAIGAYGRSSPCL